MERNFSRLIRSRMKSLGITYKGLSDLTGYTRGYLWELMAGRKRWNIEVMEVVGEAVGVQILFIPKAG